MFSISNLCILCLNYKNLKSILIEDNEGLVIQKKLKYCLPEIVDSHLDIPEYICINCMSKLDCFYKFKQWCLQNHTNLKNYLKTLTFNDKTHKYLSVRLTDIKYQNEEQAESEGQTLPNIGSKDELGIEGNEDNSICIKEEQTVFNNEINHADEDEEKDTIVKKEGLISEDKDDIEFYDKFLKTIKNETNQSDSDVSVASSEDLHEDAEYLINNSTESEENKVRVKTKIKKTTMYKCATCSKEFTRKQAFEYHIKTHAGIKDLSCSMCDKKFRKKTHLVRHQQSHTGVKNYECAVCKKKFTHKNNLTKHEKIHSIIKNYECEICKKKFTLKDNLTKHQIVHSNIKNYECEICKKTFKRKGDGVKHKKIHTGVKNFECSTCKKRFMRKHQLASHENIHNGIKNLQCSICKKLFMRKQELILHENIHKGIKNYECTICKKRFTQKSTLNRHIQIHSKEKNYECKVCKKLFKQKSELHDHEKIHTE